MTRKELLLQKYKAWLLANQWSEKESLQEADCNYSFWTNPNMVFIVLVPKGSVFMDLENFIYNQIKGIELYYNCNCLADILMQEIN